jgi:hypothetical protein
MICGDIFKKNDLAGVFAIRDLIEQSIVFIVISARLANERKSHHELLSDVLLIQRNNVIELIVS